ISSGSRTFGAIQNRTGLTEYALNGCLVRMQSIGLVEKRDSMFKSKKSKAYVIVDYPASFYYAVVDRNCSVLDNRGGGSHEALKAVIPTHLGMVFEDFCRRFVALNYPCTEVGSWWGDVPCRGDDGTIVREDGKAVTEQIDIDVIAVIRKRENRITLFGECTFISVSIGKGVLERLMERSDSASPDANARYALFSVSGFTDEVLDMARADGRIMLFGLDVLSGRSPPPDL
ncbi:MAG: hypothetical protein IJL79_02090, partial [Candidatus Methanomethylophilaceae archaeon]|nr:hypothetical protein [Candidatus Methanomethylophilaceae archaeon]